MADIRQKLDKILDDLGDEDLKEIVKDALDAEKLKWGFCGKCRSKVQVDYPDLDKRAKVLALLIDQAKGKPAETKQVVVSVHHDALPQELNAEQLRAIASGEAEVIEGEFSEVA